MSPPRAFPGCHRREDIMPDVSQKCTAAEEAIEKAGMTFWIVAPKP